MSALEVSALSHSRRSVASPGPLLFTLGGIPALHSVAAAAPLTTKARQPLRPLRELHTARLAEHILVPPPCSHRRLSYTAAAQPSLFLRRLPRLHQPSFKPTHRHCGRAQPWFTGLESPEPGYCTVITQAHRFPNFAHLIHHGRCPGQSVPGPGGARQYVVFPPLLPTSALVAYQNGAERLNVGHALLADGQ